MAARIKLGAIGCACAGALVAIVAVGADEFPTLPEPPPCEEINNEYTGDDCTVDFATSDLEFCFSDQVPAGSGYPNADGADGQIFVVATGNQTDCGTVLVKEDGYYAIFDSELSESCADQLDETGYLTVHNSCNADGWAVERNVGDRFLVMDADNEGAGCTDDATCGTGKVCREGNNHGRCCVPDQPVYMGTYLMVAGEENVICIHHWCPEWEEALAGGTDLGFVHDEDNPQNNCVSADSIHFKIAATSLVCLQSGYVQACTGGCDDGNCLPHPCYEANCPNYCQMNAAGEAECVDANPCANIICEHGCLFGLCLQGPGARGPDADGDGFSELADCDDDNPNAYPGASEDCENSVDDDCNGFIDDCGEDFDFDAGTGGTTPGSGVDPLDPTEDSGGCGCRLASHRSTSPLGALWLALGLLCWPLRRRLS